MSNSNYRKTIDSDKSCFSCISYSIGICWYSRNTVCETKNNFICDDYCPKDHIRFDGG